MKMNNDEDEIMTNDQDESDIENNEAEVLQNLIIKLVDRDTDEVEEDDSKETEEYVVQGILPRSRINFKIWKTIVKPI